MESLSDLPEFALGSVLSYLPLESLYSELLTVCKKVRAFICTNHEFLQTLSAMYLSPDLSPQLPLASMLSDVTRSHTGLLALRGYFTDGGVMRSWGRFCFHNMFEYSGTVYSTNRRAKDVHTKAYFLGEFGKDLFSVRTNEDLEWRRRGRVPLPFQANELMDRCDPGPKPCYLPGFNTMCKTDMQDHSSMEEMTIEEDVPLLDKAAVVSKVAICRPGMATGPVRTLAIYTSMKSDPWTPECPEPPRSIEELLTVFPHTDVQATDSWACGEARDAEGPWLWVQFTSVACSRAVLELRRPRCLMHMLVVLIDRDDRREEYQMFLKTLDIAYVCLFGKIVRLVEE